MKRGRMRPVFRPDGVVFPGDSTTEADLPKPLDGDKSESMSISDALLAAYSAELHQRDSEIRRLRGLLHECLSFALGAPIGWSSDLWERVTNELGGFPVRQSNKSTT